MERLSLCAAVVLSLGLVGCAAETGNDTPPTAEPTGESPPAETPGGDAGASQEPEEASESPSPEPASQASFDPESIHVLVNKHHPLDPADHEPADLREVDVPNEFGSAQLRQEAAAALEELFDAAEQDGVDLWITTAYREFEFQQQLYDQRFAEQGQEATDRVSARPGYSEHQTGLAADVADLQNRDCYLSACFGETEQGLWLEDHAHEYGFVIRYPQGAEDITGYSYEPWHLRYVGEETADDVVERGATLEEYWDQSPAPDYEYDYDAPGS